MKKHDEVACTRPSSIDNPSHWASSLSLFLWRSRHTIPLETAVVLRTICCLEVGLKWNNLLLRFGVSGTEYWNHGTESESQNNVPAVRKYSSYNTINRKMCGLGHSDVQSGCGSLIVSGRWRWREGFSGIIAVHKNRDPTSVTQHDQLSSRARARNRHQRRQIMGNNLDRRVFPARPTVYVDATWCIAQRHNSVIRACIFHELHRRWSYKRRL